MRKSSVLTLALIFIIVTVLVSSTSPISVTAGTSSTTTVYFNKPTINGTEIGVNQTIKVNIMIRDAVNVFSWQAGLRFNATLLKCNFFKQGTFLSSAGSTLWLPADIDNTAGVIDAHACLLLGHGKKKSGNGILGYLNFTVKAPGVSDLHLRDVEARKEVDWDTVMIPLNIIDVYTVVVNATVHKVVTVSNSTSFMYVDLVAVHSGFYDHAYNPTLKEISFKVTGPYPGWSTVTIPKALLQPESPYVWTPIIDGNRLSIEERTVTSNLTHYSIYFKYSLGVHQVQITTRFLPSTILMDLSATSIILESNITINGNITAADPIDPVRSGVTVTISYRLSGETAWTTLASVPTNQTSDYNYTWMPENVRTYEFKASWGGDSETLGDESDIQTLVVQPIPPSIYVFPADGYYVVIESNSTVFDFDFNATLNEVSFNVSRPYGDVYFSNVTIPRPLMWADNLDEWAVTIDGGRLDTEERTVTTNTTHSSVYFTYTPGDHKIQITTRFVLSNITIALSEDSITLESSVTISGSIDPVRSGVTVTILYRSVGDTAWTFLANVTTSQFSNYSYVWTPENVGSYEVMASWGGDSETLSDETDPPYPTLTVEEAPTSEGFDVYLVVGIAVAIIVIAAIAVYFLKFRKPKS